MDGYISWHRQSERNFLHPLQEKRKFTRYEAWQDLVSLAYFKDKEKLIQGKLTLIKRGTFDTAVIQLAERWKWHRNTTENFLTLLESQYMITRLKTNDKNIKSCTILKINKYDDFQSNFKQECTSECTTECTTECTPKNKDNKENNLPPAEEEESFVNLLSNSKYCSFTNGNRGIKSLYSDLKLAFPYLDLKVVALKVKNVNKKIDNPQSYITSICQEMNQKGKLQDSNFAQKEILPEDTEFTRKTVEFESPEEALRRLQAS